MVRHWTQVRHVHFEMSEIFWKLEELFNENFIHLLELRETFVRDRWTAYAQEISDAGAPLENWIGFINCTRIKIVRPGGENAFQQVCFSGHKKFHCLTYQSPTTPDGLILALFGPVEGRRNNSTLLHNNNWNAKLQNCLTTDMCQFYVYGDSAYRIKPFLQRLLRGNLAEQLKNFNAAMYSMRVSVEHSNKDVKQEWLGQYFSLNLCVRKVPIGLLYKVLTNFRLCFY